MINIHKQPNTEYEIGTEITFDAEASQEALETVFSGLGRAIDNIKLEARMIAFDALHGTNYRQVRHALAAEKRNSAFEASIGLQRV